jgi:hypothetical protein
VCDCVCMRKCVGREGETECVLLIDRSNKTNTTADILDPDSLNKHSLHTHDHSDMMQTERYLNPHYRNSF